MIFKRLTANLASLAFGVLLSRFLKSKIGQNNPQKRRGLGLRSVSKMSWIFSLHAAALFSLELPDQFSIVERPLQLFSTFDLIENDHPFGTIARDPFSIKPNFTFEGAASARARLLSWGLVIDVEDSEGKQIGIIQEDVWRLYYWTEFQIFNEEGKLIALAIMDPLQTAFSIVDPEHRDDLIALINRPLVSYQRDTWNVQLFNRENVDPRLLLFLPLYQSTYEFFH